MKLLLIPILVLLSLNILGQKQCVVRLVDSYSLNQIELDHSFELNKKHYIVDTAKNVIIINKPFGRRLLISSNSYVDFEEKIVLRNHKSDTLTLQLDPVESIIKERYKEIWDETNEPSDTIALSSKSSVENLLLSYLKYLYVIRGVCNNGLCNYSNTYRYNIHFVDSNSVFTLKEIVKLQPMDYKCDELDNHLDILKSIFPKFTLEEENKEFWIHFTISL